jgi:hypothetical protein
MPYPAPRELRGAALRATTFEIEKKEILPYSILVGVAEDSDVPQLSGQLEITDASGNQYRKSFDLRPPEDSSWLQTKEKDGYVIATTNNDPVLKEFFKRGGNYQCSLKFDQSREDLSVWFMTLRGVGLCFPTN